MVKDYFAILGLAPGCYAPAEVTRRFHTERQSLLGQLNNPATHGVARQKLDELHIAYMALRDPQAQAECLRISRDDRDDLARLRHLIAASLEDGLLRYSRRQEILACAEEIGLSEFQTQLLIAQVQFGDDQIETYLPRPQLRRKTEIPRAWARLAAIGVLAVAMFLALVRWLGV
ncbi:MAG: hypothetical protein ABIG44_17400 [Planctomycetota bacterium]